MIRLIIAFIFGYIIYKAIQLFSRVYFTKQSSNSPGNIHQNKNNSTKIDKRDVIEAQFEEIDVNENPSSNK